ncbi:exodeoxyribonuclease V subunit alpha [Oceanospirillum linum]|uniref:RecBCD enzyme subunit RecD n=1 Tax=Oceanospirillum linum TaxID=966 RepID=A0A1T1HC71_OCELI|nr:exodeoxyribonuclease V subunit alpha [Oceanospirillum linum]OOV87451.1 exodeoxyribonuclease V subunit alpha [Oceanospirillum linum]SEF88166.1 DNA helicase/exodeoxyribonuclease V, alpha subunit [Oleiphilus messinensis]SMP13863.1 DNA helicase/exodeoxyribonuclease V, alpha subunit [Oceanospirillum linum]
MNKPILTKQPDDIAFLQQLELWQESGAIRALDLALARFIARQIPEAECTDAVLLAITLVSERTAHGNVCLDLAQARQDPSGLLSPIGDERLRDLVGQQLRSQLSACSVTQWQAELRQCSAVDDLSQQSAESHQLQDVESHQPQDIKSPQLHGIDSHQPQDIKSPQLHGIDSHQPQDIGRHQRPLVLTGSPEKPLLYLRRYWQYEQDVRRGIEQRLKPLPVSEKLRAILDIVFGPERDQIQPNWQKVACGLSARSGFSIITGGPGTGKTTTVVRLLALLQGLELAEGHSAKVIRLAAPTGKAAARLNESIAGSVHRLNITTDQLSQEQQALFPGKDALNQWQASIPTEVSTLHRLLGSQPNTRHFRHNQANPLPADIVVIDEASMVDIEMMAKLMSALRPDARLILLGDKDQLASVEAGSILGDLCDQAEDGHYSQKSCTYVRDTTGQLISHDYQASPSTLKLPRLARMISQTTTMLRHCYRSEGQNLLDFAAWVNQQGILNFGMQGLQRYFEPASKELSYLDLPIRSEGQREWSDFNQLIVAGYQPYLKKLSELEKLENSTTQVLEQQVFEIFRLHKQFQLLCAVRQGDFGVEGLNHRIRQLLASRRLIPGGEQQWYPGRPVLITQNDYSLKLMNGDIGICMQLPEEGQAQTDTRHFRVAFPDGQGGIRWVLPSRLQGVETVFAMTVHKSQGSEFDHTALILPDKVNAVLTKELLYTGITRSKTRFTLIVPEQKVLEAALQQKISRISGLLSE